MIFPLCRLQAMAGRKAGGGQESQGVEVALAPEELELDPMAMTQKYEEHVREQQAQVEKEDFSDMVAEHAAKQKVRSPFSALDCCSLAVQFLKDFYTCCSEDWYSSSKQAVEMYNRRATHVVVTTDFTSIKAFKVVVTLSEFRRILGDVVLKISTAIPTKKKKKAIMKTTKRHF